MSNFESTIPERRGRPIVAIVGRPNVGKSTFFNRLVGGRRAIVEDVAGVTRDRHYADVEWEGRAFTVVDTGGFLPDTEDRLLQQVRDQARLAIDEAHSVILMVDGMTGLTAADQEIAGMLRKSGKPVFVAVNKIDSARREEEQYFTDFYRIGFAHVFAVSAEHARGVGALMDALAEGFPEIKEVEEPEEQFEPLDESEEGDEGVEGEGEDGEGQGEGEGEKPLLQRPPRVCRVAIVGRPNVGKSTFINSLIGEERHVASDIPGTTTDPVDSRIEHDGRSYVLTDTAGIRRKRSIAARVEQYSVMRALSTIDRADVVLVLLDATEPAVDQDAKIASVAFEKGKALVIVVNKWDLVENTSKADEFLQELKRAIPFVSFAPVLLVSALTGMRVFKALELAGEVYEHSTTRLPTPLLNDFLRKIVDEHPAPLFGLYPVRLFYMAQVGYRPPTFAITCNKPEGVTEDYQRFIINRMRAAFGLKVPIKLLPKARSKRAFNAKRGKGR